MAIFSFEKYSENKCRGKSRIEEQKNRINDIKKYEQYEQNIADKKVLMKVNL